MPVLLIGDPDGIAPPDFLNGAPHDCTRTQSSVCGVAAVHDERVTDRLYRNDGESSEACCRTDEHLAATALTA
jgi:hypothetical protein